MSLLFQRYRVLLAGIGVVALGSAFGMWGYHSAAADHATSRGLSAAFGTWLLGGGALFAYAWRYQYASRETLIHTLTQAVEQSQSAIAIVGADGRVAFVNAGVCRQRGLDRTALVGRSWEHFRHPHTPPETFAEMAARLRAGEAWEGEWLCPRAQGDPLPVRGLLSPVRDVDGLPTGFIAVLTDASAFHHRQAELSAAKDAAEAADRAKGDFLAVISHEVRTPLNGIVGFTNLLLDTPLTSEQREYVQTIRTSGEALVQLTGDILDFSRIASGSVPLEAAPCDVRGIVEDTLDIFARHAAERRIELLHHIDPDVPLQVLADPGRLRQVLVNLVGNAIKFTPSGEVALTLRVLTGKAHSLAPFDALTPGQLVAELDDGSLALEFAVRDTGIGIAPEDRAKLFQPFTQLDATSVRRYGGAGLGLAISRMLVRLMGGDIWLESEPGRGSTFSFTVRVCPAPGTEPPSSPPSLVGRRIALAIPSASLRRELTAVLTAAAAQPIDVPAEAPLVESGWDLAIVDLDANARQRLRTLPAPAPTLAARIFGLVDVTFPSTERRTLRTHVRMLLNKPVHQRTLLDLLARALERPRDREPTAAALHVLVAEDDDVHRRATQGLLEHLGCICDGARDGRECLRRIAQTPYDVMFLDVHLPELDGLSVLRAVRAGEAGAASRTLWVAVLTADRRDEMRDMVFSAGADDFLAKPFSLAAAETTLRRRASARAATEPPVGR